MPITDIIDCRRGVPRPTDVALILTEQQAQVIRDIVGTCVVGSGRRDLTTHIYLAMDDAGLKSSSKGDYEGHIKFL